jgi:hypothetical protein
MGREILTGIISDKDIKHASCCDSPSDCRTRNDLKPFAVNMPNVADCCNLPDKFSSDKTEVCCGPPEGPISDTNEKAGYRICSFVERFEITASGNIPIVATRLDARDYLWAFLVRIGIGRNHYKISPGLYGVGNPGNHSPVLVTANYKLTFDTLRKELKGIDAWLLVLDTRGINVWCAAGKGTFSTEELVNRVRLAGLEKVVNHRELVVPQLGATGVAGYRVKKSCGFKIIWGPIKAEDIRAFLENEKKATEAMRKITFTIGERLVLIPVEISELFKPTLWAMILAFIISGIGSDFFSFSAAWHRGTIIFMAYVAGILSGAIAVPVFLPWLPGKAFSFKGIWTGVMAGLFMLLFFLEPEGTLEIFSIMLISMTVSSFFAMNFTGATPFTSPSGVEKEMRKAIPIQAATMLIAIALWIGAGFTT